MTRSSRPAFRYGLTAIGVDRGRGAHVRILPLAILRHPLERYMSGYLQRDVTIGNLAVDPGWRTHVEIDDLTIGNAAWSDIKQMAHARRADLFFSPWALLKVEPDAVKLWEPDVLLEKNTDGAANWRFGDDGVVLWPHLEAIDVDRGKVRYLDPRLRADVAAQRADRIDGRGSNAAHQRSRQAARRSLRARGSRQGSRHTPTAGRALPAGAECARWRDEGRF